MHFETTSRNNFVLVCLFPLKLHIAEHPAGHLVLKWLIEQDEKMRESGKEGMLEIQLYLIRLTFRVIGCLTSNKIVAFISLGILEYGKFNIIVSVSLLL